jgi:signal transduction histidine kinase
MTIKKKLILSTITINATLLIICITLLFGYRYVTKKASLANDFDKESMYLQMMLRGLNEVIINEGVPSIIEADRDGIETQAVRDGLEGFDTIHRRLLAEIEETQLQVEITEGIDPKWQFIKENVDPLFKHYHSLEGPETMIMASKLIKNIEDVFEIVSLLSEKTRAVVNENSVKSTIIQDSIIKVIIIVLLLSVFLSYKIYRSITAPINNLNMIAEGFSKGDLSVTMDESRKDEFGLLALHFNKSIEKLKQYTRELQDFAHIASHDLQEPLRKILAFSERLSVKYSGSLGDQGINYLERMQRAAGRMQRLVESLLVYSQVIKHEKPFVTVDLMEVANGVLTDLEVQIQDVDGHVEIGTLPTLHADPAQMQQLFENIILNALKFNKKNEPPSIKVTSKSIHSSGNNPHSNESGDEYCQIYFQDNGIGFDEKYADRIFKVFQRLHGQNEYEGTGIGLSLCHKIVERHGGSIEAESSPGVGSKFIVSLPVDSHEGGFNE